MIYFPCPRCGLRMSSADANAGQKTECPVCRQRLQIPLPPRNKTILAQAEDEMPGPPPGPPVALLAEESPPRRRRRRRPPREEEEHGECDHCGGRLRPSSRVATVGWVLICCGILFWPLILVGAFLQERWLACADCGRRVRKLSDATFQI